MRSNSAIFMFAFFLNLGQHLNKRIGSCGSTFLPLGVDGISIRSRPLEKQNRKSKLLFPFVQMADSMNVCSYTLNGEEINIPCIKHIL